MSSRGCLRHPWLITIAFVAGASAAFSEMPSWDQLREQLVMTRHHWFGDLEADGTRFTGLWCFDPETGALTRLRGLTLTWQWQGMIPRDYTGYGHVLATHGDRVVLQIWPHDIEFEAASWRLLRRYPPTVRFGEEAGWAVQGAIVSEPAALSLGLESGVYGFATCVLNLTTRGRESPPSKCAPFQYPGWDEALDRGGDYSVLLHRSLGPLASEPSFAADVTPYQYHDHNVPSLSFDQGRGGFWRAAPQAIEFLPVSAGQFQPASVVHALDFPSLRDGWELFALHLHPASGRIFGVAEDADYLDWVFFGLGQDLSSLATYDVPHTLEVGWPISITSLDEPPESHVQTVPVVSRTNGRNDTFWSSDLWLYNPSDEPMTAHVRRVIARREVRTVALPARGSVKIEDVLSWVGGGPAPAGDGTKNDALVLTSPYRWGRNLVAVSRTFTAHEGGGTYGQAVSAVPDIVGYSNHLPYPDDVALMRASFRPATRTSNVVLDLREPGRYRHNLGVVNDGDESVRLSLLWGNEGDEYGLWRAPPETFQHINVAPHSVRIINLEKRFPPIARDHWPPRIAVFGDRPVLLWLSMVDNLTGDATFVPFTNYTWPEEGLDDRSVVPVVGHNAGKHGTFWVTNLYGAQGESWHQSGRGDYDRPPAFFYPQRPSTQCGGGAASNGEITVDLRGDIGMPLDVWLETIADLGLNWSVGSARAGREIIFRDVVRQFQECSQDEDVKGGMEILTQSWTNGYTRTFTTRPDGGTYGGMLPLYPPNGWPVQHFAGIEVGGEFRINLGFFNGDHEHAITHRVTLYRADGTEVASTEFDLAPLRLKQQSLERVLGLAKGALEPGTYGLTVLPLDDDETGVQGRSWAFVSLVENTTGDPTNWW